MRGGLDGKIALVTGGGSGLGAAISDALAASGAQVAVADVRPEAAARTVADVTACGGTAWPVGMDVSDRLQVARAFEELRAGTGALDILVNNAAIDYAEPVDEIDEEAWLREIQVNLAGAFLTSRHALPMMKRRGGGNIVNIASTAARRAWANASAYHASKWGLLGFSHALHVEGRPHNIKVTAVISGGMRTPFLLDRFDDIDQTTLQDPANVANTVLFVLDQPDDCVIPEIMVLPMKETSWP
jgi:NAD(P)-dependent dehydrogenase (short-subunit alcohol dehydrogenase family)